MTIEQLHTLFVNSKGISTDTRSTRTNQLFFALKGDNFNGNTFAWQAINKGAAYAIIDEQEHAKDEKYILVQDVLKTLQDLAQYHRNYLKIPILAITGSNGKTTSKELIHAVLKKKYNTVATVGNLNNHIGVPLTLLSLKKDTEFGIIEMGANHPGEIKLLCEIARPDYGYITNFGKAHLEGFGSIEGVIKAKSELYDHLMENDKLLFLNIDDSVQKEKTSYKKVYTFGSSQEADISFAYIPTTEKAGIVYKDLKFDSQLTGNYNSINIAAALCIGSYFKIEPQIIKNAIHSYSPQSNRSQLLKIGTTTLLMDAYNANPTSMKAALDSFKNYPAPNKFVILGDMFELGNDAEKEHQEIVKELENSNFQQAYLTGSNFYRTETSVGNIKKLETFNDLEKELSKVNLSNTHILVKGSRGMALERIIDAVRLQIVK